MKRCIGSLPLAVLAPALLVAAACFCTSVAAQPAPAAPASSASAAADDGLTEGDIRDIDRAARTVTLRHGEIVNVGMPAMTMVFSVDRAAGLESLKVGDRVRFRVEKVPAGLVVMKIRLVQ